MLWVDCVGWLPSAAGWVVLASLLLDALLGDPVRPTHPVVLIGKMIGALEKMFYHSRPFMARLSGIVLVSTVLSFVLLVSLGILWMSWQLSPWLAFIVSVWGVYTSIAPRELARAAQQVYLPLVTEGAGDRLEQARTEVSQIVGRDTDSMDEQDVVRATVETVAENVVDALVAPVMYGLLFGMPGALVYRAINTMDSLLGYKNERYRYFGCAAARLDDVANWLPARLTGVFLLLVGRFHRFNVRNGWRSWRRDAAAHASPNSGIPEAVVAGLLEVRLGGVNSYEGRPVASAYLGENRRPLQVADICKAQQLLWGVTWICGILSICYGVLWFIFKA